MKKISLALALCCASFYSMADQLPLGGFSYGPMEAPTGKEWESPENLALNKEQPHAYIFPFQDVESARKVLPENSKFWQSLDGDWKFNWAPDPDSRPKDFYKTEFDVSGWDNIPVPSSWNIYGVQKDGSLKYGVPIYVNQHVGSGKIVKVLRGSKAQDLSYLNPESLPSFGMLDEVPEARIRDVLSQMATDGFLTIAEGRLPIVGFGPRAAETVAPEFHYDIKKIKRADARARRTPDVSTPAVGSYVPDDGDEALFQKLRALRLDIARELGKPPYIVFSDKTLRDMVRVKPITDDQFLAVNGVGESKLKQYGERFMAAIREDSGDEA